MTSFAIISDIHGNQPALEAIKADIERYPVDKVIALGDYINPFASPLENLRTLEEMDAVIILGNNEERLLKARAGELDHLRGYQQWFPLFYNEEHLREYDFSGLTYRLTIEAEGRRLACMHSTPDSTSEGAIPDAFIRSGDRNRGIERINEILLSLDADFWLTGHTHRCFSHSAFGKTAINPGSAGMTLNGTDLLSLERPVGDFGGVLLMDYIDSGRARYSPNTTYVRLDLHRDYYSVVFRTLQYDYRRTVQEMLDSGLARESRAWTRLIVAEMLTGQLMADPFLSLAFSLQAEKSVAFSDEVWHEAERLFPFPIPPLL